MASRFRSLDEDWIAMFQQRMVRLLVFLLLISSNAYSSY